MIRTLARDILMCLVIAIALSQTIGTDQLQKDDE